MRRGTREYSMTMMDSTPSAPALSAGPSTGLDARVARTRAALCRTLLVLLEEKPFEQVTVREIAAKAGVGYATFFRHYADKDALLNDLAAREIRDLIGMTVPILHMIDSRASCRALCAYVWEHRKLWSALLTGGAAGAMREEFIEQAREVAADWPAVESGVPNDLRVVLAATGVVAVLAWWLKQPEPFASDRIAEILDQLVVGASIAGARPETIGKAPG